MSGQYLYNEVFRRIAEWHGQDAAVRTATMGALVQGIVELRATAETAATHAAGHDDAGEREPAGVALAA